MPHLHCAVVINSGGGALARVAAGAGGQERNYPFSEQKAVFTAGRGFGSLGKVGVFPCVPREWHGSGPWVHLYLPTYLLNRSLLQRAEGEEEVCHLNPGQKPTWLERTLEPLTWSFDPQLLC